MLIAGTTGLFKNIVFYHKCDVLLIRFYALFVAFEKFW